MGERVSLKDVMTETPTSSRSPVFLITCAILLGAVLSGCTNSLPLDTPWNTPVGAVSASWTAVGQPGFTPGSVNRINIGFTPGGTLLASFSDQLAGGNASLAADAQRGIVEKPERVGRPLAGFPGADRLGCGARSQCRAAGEKSLEEIATVCHGHP